MERTRRVGHARGWRRPSTGLEEPAVEKIAKDQREDPFQVLIATMLSAQTKDAVTARGLDAPVPGRAHAEDRWRSCRCAKIQELIYPVSFYRNKAVHVRQTCEQILDALSAAACRRRWRSC